MNGALFGASMALVLVALVVVAVLWRRQCADVRRWRQWYGMR